MVTGLSLLELDDVLVTDELSLSVSVSVSQDTVGHQSTCVMRNLSVSFAMT